MAKHVPQDPSAMQRNKRVVEDFAFEVASRMDDTGEQFDQAFDTLIENHTEDHNVLQAFRPAVRQIASIVLA